MPPASAPPTRAGVEIAADVATLAAAGPVIILSLPSAKALEATVAAIAADKLPAKTIVETSTFKIDEKQRAEQALRKAGHVMLDCPVSGTGAQAAVKDIVVYASGDKKAIAKLKPMFARVLPRGLRRRRLRQWQPDEIHRQSSGHHP